MSGGIAYVLDEAGDFKSRCNREMVRLTPLEDDEEIEAVKNMIFRHAEYTGSGRATEVLLGWSEMVHRFIRVIPNDYQRVLETRKELLKGGMTVEAAEQAAFELNSSLNHG
jgi:glutamate synthase (ferredoxin)